MTRVPTKDLFKKNGDASPLFSRYNSGATRRARHSVSARFLDAEEALAIGLIHFIEDRSEIGAKVSAYARTIAANAPLTVYAAKGALDAAERGGRDEELANVQQLVNARFDSEDYREGRRAFAEKRTPVFRGR